MMGTGGKIGSTLNDGHSGHSLWPWNAMEIDKALGLTDLHRDHKQLNPTFISYCWTT